MKNHIKEIFIVLFLITFPFFVQAEELVIEYSGGTKTLIISDDPVQLRQDYIDMATLYLEEREIRIKAIAEADKLLFRVDDLIRINNELLDKLELAKTTIIRLDKPNFLNIGYGFQIYDEQFFQTYSIIYLTKLGRINIGGELNFPLGFKLLAGFNF